jgi:hypothetical protein
LPQLGVNTTASGPQTTGATAANPPESQPQPLEGAVLGGNIIGVGSKVKKPSFKVYQGGDSYEQWEFIWNPTGVVALPGQAPINPNVNPSGAPNPNNTNPQNGQQPPSTPGANPTTLPNQ